MLANTLCILLLAVGTINGISVRPVEYKVELPMWDLSDAYRRIVDTFKGVTIRLNLSDDKQAEDNKDKDDDEEELVDENHEDYYYNPPPWYYSVPAHPIPPPYTQPLHPPYPTYPTWPTYLTYPTPNPTEPTPNPTEPTPNPTEPTINPTEPTVNPIVPTPSPTEPTLNPTEPQVIVSTDNTKKRLRTFIIIPRNTALLSRLSTLNLPAPL